MYLVVYSALVYWLGADKVEFDIPTKEQTSL